MPTVIITTVATVELTKVMKIPEDEWNSIKADEDRLVQQVDLETYDTQTMIENEFSRVVIAP